MFHDGLAVSSFSVSEILIGSFGNIYQSTFLANDLSLSEDVIEKKILIFDTAVCVTRKFRYFNHLLPVDQV